MRPENWKKHALINFLLIAGISKKKCETKEFLCKAYFWDGTNKGHRIFGILY